MGNTEVREYGDRRLDDVAQGEHLTGLTDTCLEDADLRLIVHEPYRQRHTDLRVVGTRRACHEAVGREHLVQPLLDNGLAVGARDADDRDIELVAVTLGEALQSLEGVRHLEEVSLWEPLLVVIGNSRHHKVVNAAVVQTRDILVAVVALRLDGEEQRLLWETQRTAVGKQEADVGIRRTISACADEGGDFLNGISHWLCFLNLIAKLIKKSVRKHRKEGKNDSCRPYPYET